MNNEDVVYRYQSKELYELRISDIEQQISALQRELRDLKDDYIVLKRVTEVVDGVAISDFLGGADNIYGGPNHKFAQVIGNRWADVYINAHNRTTYGVRFGDSSPKSSHAWKSGKWQGSHFEYNEAVRIAKKWITKGVIEPRR